MIAGEAEFAWRVSLHGGGGLLGATAVRFEDGPRR